jgi:hypothetical protein
MSEDVEVYDFAQQQTQNDFAKFQIDLEAEYKEPVPLISVGDKPIFTRGNISCISGKAKSRKTFLIGLFASQFLESSATAKVIILDTEQALFHVQRSTKRIHRLLEWEENQNSEQLRVFALRELSPEQRTEFLKRAIPHFRPDLVFADGVRDLLHDFNNITESSDLVNLLMALSSGYNCHICAVLHENKGDASLRGHAGTELMNKSETVISVSKDPDSDYSAVEPKVCRNIPFEKFHFLVDENGLPQVCEAKAKPKATDKLKPLFEDIVPLPNSMSYVDLYKAVMEKTKVQERMAKRKIEQALKDGIIIKNEVDFYHLYQKPIENDPLPF